jgi:hypothetical protein
MKRPAADGRTHLVMAGVELLRKLAQLVLSPPWMAHVNSS